jgi:hypothetical protein
MKTIHSKRHKRLIEFVGEYVVKQGAYFFRDRGKVWRVYMRSQADKPNRVPLFESTRKAEAIKHARYLDKERMKIEALTRGEFSTPDEKLRAIAENYKRVLQLQQAEKDA